MRIFVSWAITPEELKQLAVDLKETPIISVRIEPNVELLITNVKAKVAQATDTSPVEPVPVVKTQKQTIRKGMVPAWAVYEVRKELERTKKGDNIP